FIHIIHVNFFEQGGENFYLFGNFKKIVLKRCSCKKDGDCQNRNDNQFLESVFHVLIFFEPMEQPFLHLVFGKIEKRMFHIKLFFSTFFYKFLQQLRHFSLYFIKSWLFFPNVQNH